MHGSACALLGLAIAAGATAAAATFTGSSAPQAAANATDEVEREWSARAIALGEVDAAELMRRLQSDDWLVRHTALDALGRSSHALQRRADGRDPVVLSQVMQALQGALRDPRPELARAAHRVLEVNRATLAAGSVPSLSQGAETSFERRARALRDGDVSTLPWEDVGAIFVALVAAPDRVRERAATALATRLGSAAQPAGAPALALALAAHVRELLPDERAAFERAAPELVEGFGADIAERVLTAAARLGPQGPCGRLLVTAAALPEGTGKFLALRAGAEAETPAALVELTASAPAPLTDEALVAVLRALAATGAPWDGAGEAQALARFAQHPSVDVRAAALSVAEGSVSEERGAARSAPAMQEPAADDWGAPLLLALLQDPDEGLAVDAFRALVRRPGFGAELYAAWRAARPLGRSARLRALDRTRPWPEFREDFLALVRSDRDSDALELLGALGADPAVAAELRAWFAVEVQGIVAPPEVHDLDPLDARLLYDGRATELALALARAREACRRSGAGLLDDLDTLFDDALGRCMALVHPPGSSTRARLPKTLVKLMGAEPAGRVSLRAYVPRASAEVPSRVRTEVAITLALADEAAHTLAPTLAEHLCDAVLASEPELAVRAVEALGALARGCPEPAAQGIAERVARLVARWDELGAEDVRVALAQVAAPDPRHHRALIAVSDGAADDTVAAALLEAAAAAPRGRSVSLAALARFEASAGLAPLDPASGAVAVAGEPRATALTVEQALVRREAVLSGFARGARERGEALPDDVAARLFVRPLAAARADLAAALDRAAFGSVAPARAEFRFRGELDLGAALAETHTLGALLDATLGWWRADARFLAALARSALPREPTTAARLAEAALVALRGTFDGEAGRHLRVELTALALLHFAAARADVFAVLQRTARAGADVALDSADLAGAARRAAAAALELDLMRRRLELSFGLDSADPYVADSRELYRVLGELHPLRREDPGAHLAAAVSLFEALADWAAGRIDDGSLAERFAQPEVQAAGVRSRAAERLQADLAALLRAGYPALAPRLR